jgi:hypothetical protein
MIMFYSGNAGVPRIEPETYLKGKGNVMLTFHWISEQTSQMKRFKDILKARKEKHARKKK